MAEARSKAEWTRTASQMAMLANIHRDPKKHRPYAPDDFNPHAKKRTRAIPVPLSILKTLFVDQKGR
jgi:hypothetical protein